MKIKSYLPIFPGFYSTIFDSDMAEENFLEEAGLTSDDLQFDYKDYMNRVAEACINSVESYMLTDGFRNFDIEFEKVQSPREYNFTNDVIYCTYDIDEREFNELVDYCKTYLEDFTAYLKDKHSSYSGFSSFFDTEPQTWFNEYLKEDNDKFERAFVGILEFYLRNEGYSEEDMYYDNEETSFIYSLEEV